VIPRRLPDSELVGVQFNHVIALLVAGMKELKADNDNLRAPATRLCADRAALRGQELATAVRLGVSAAV